MSCRRAGCAVASEPRSRPTISNRVDERRSITCIGRKHQLQFCANLQSDRHDHWAFSKRIPSVTPIRDLPAHLHRVFRGCALRATKVCLWGSTSTKVPSVRRQPQALGDCFSRPSPAPCAPSSCRRSSTTPDPDEGGRWVVRRLGNGLLEQRNRQPGQLLLVIHPADRVRDLGNLRQLLLGDLRQLQSDDRGCRRPPNSGTPGCWRLRAPCCRSGAHVHNVSALQGGCLVTRRSSPSTVCAAMESGFRATICSNVSRAASSFLCSP